MEALITRYKIQTPNYAITTPATLMLDCPAVRSWLAIPVAEGHGLLGHLSSIPLAV